MRKILAILPATAAYFFVLLFCYAAVSKLLDFENFQVQIAQSPLLSAFAGYISYSVIIAELITAVLLCFKNTRMIGLYLSLGIMVSFTVYIYLILNFSDFIPCSCGGILEKMDWAEHLTFNIGCVLFAFMGIYAHQQQERKRPYKIVIASVDISLISAGVVVGLFLSSENIIKHENNFTRRFLLHPIIEDKKIDLGLNSYYFAGTKDNRIYLGNITAPLNLTIIDTALREKSQSRIILDHADHQFKNLHLEVRPPCYYLYDGSVPIIYRGIIGDSIAKTVSFREAFFNQLAVVGYGRFVIRSQSSKNRQYLLGVLNAENSEKVVLQPEILEKQVDGVFDVDGRLVNNTSGNDLIYMYSYRNQFIVLDTNLKVRRYLNTIDTTQRARISTIKLSDGKHKMNAPPLKVNASSTLNRQILFNQSMLRGRNEAVDIWQQATVIDIYRTDRKEYIGSFYIYHKNNAKMSDMLATDKYLYILIGNELIRYHFRDIITKLYK